MTKQYFVYILANSRNTVLYVGITNDLARRIWQHKNKVAPKSFTAHYNIEKLVYYEIFEDAYEAISREKQLKAGSRQKKLNLINNMNHEWNDLSPDL
jgi:putative endonuclease